MALHTKAVKNHAFWVGNKIERVSPDLKILTKIVIFALITGLWNEEKSYQILQIMINNTWKRNDWHCHKSRKIAFV